MDSCRLLLHQRFLAQKITLIQLDDPGKIGFPRRGLIGDLMPVESHLGFQPKRVTGTQADRDQSISGTSIHQLGPNPFRRVWIEIELEPVFASVACAGNEAIKIANLTPLEPVVLDGCQIGIDQRLQNFQYLRTLQGQLAVLVADVHNLGIERILVANPIEVFFSIGRVDAQSDDRWPGELLVPGGSATLPVGSFVFLLDGRFVGLVVKMPEGPPAIAPAALVSASLDLMGGSGTEGAR